MKSALAVLCPYLILLAAAAAQEKPGKPPRPAAVIDIRNLKGEPVGKGLLFPAEPRGVKLQLDITKLPPGDHLFHIHQKPICDAAEEFDTAGARYDPTGEYRNDDHKDHRGHAAGDPLMTLKVAEDGTGRLSVVFPELTLGKDGPSVFANGGTAIIFHAVPGAKGPSAIACGVIQPK